MFDRGTSEAGAAQVLDVGLSDRWTSDELEQRLIGLEAVVSRARAEQLRLLRRADIAQLATQDGSRSLQEWTAARLDVTPELAKDLVHAARSITDELEDDLGRGDLTFGRAVATSRLVAAGAPQHVVESSSGFDLAGVRRLTSRHSHLSPGDEAATFDSRHAAIQLTLDQTSANVWAKLTGVDSEIVTQALQEWGDRLPTLPDGSRDTLAHRQADAFVAIFHHALASDGNETTNSGGPHLLLTADLAVLAESGGTKGVSVVGGPRIGINALEEALCNGSVSLDVKLEDGRILGVGSTSDVIPPRVRRYVLARDGGCTADACRSRYHLEVHHIVPRSQGGGHDLGNLTTLCWFHHHVVVHGMEYAIDPNTPPQRRRFKPPDNGPP